MKAWLPARTPAGSRTVATPARRVPLATSRPFSRSTTTPVGVVWESVLPTCTTTFPPAGVEVVVTWVAVCAGSMARLVGSETEPA